MCVCVCVCVCDLWWVAEESDEELQSFKVPTVPQCHNTMLTVDKHCSDVCCDEFSLPQIDAISTDLQHLANHVCVEFARKPRSLNEFDRWKAVELRLFLLYLGPVVLRKQLTSDLYHHFMLLHVAVSILVNREMCKSHCDYAEKLLHTFVKDLSKLYGEQSMIYTMHSLIHICDDVRRFGSVDEFSAFPFENTLGRMKRMIRNGKLPLMQICRRLSEYAQQHKNSINQLVSLQHCEDHIAVDRV